MRIDTANRAVFVYEDHLAEQKLAMARAANGSPTHPIKRISKNGGVLRPTIVRSKSETAPPITATTAPSMFAALSRAISLLLAVYSAIRYGIQSGMEPTIQVVTE